MDKDHILFDTEQASSFIATSHIKEMVVKKDGGKK